MANNTMKNIRLAFYVHPDDAPALRAIVAQLNAAREAQKSPFKGGPYRAMADVKSGDTITDIDGQPRTVCKFSNADTAAGQIPWPMATAGQGKPAPVITGDLVAAARNEGMTATCKLFGLSTGVWPRVRTVLAKHFPNEFYEPRKQKENA